MIGYSMGGYAMGYFTPPLAPGEGPEAVSPNFALGVDAATGTLGSADALASIREEIERNRETV